MREDNSPLLLSFFQQWSRYPWRMVGRHGTQMPSAGRYYSSVRIFFLVKLPRQAVVLMALELPLGLSRGIAADGLFSTVSSCMTSSFNSSLVLRNLYTIIYLEISSYKFCIRAMISSQIHLLLLKLTCAHFLSSTASL